MVFALLQCLQSEHDLVAVRARGRERTGRSSKASLHQGQRVEFTVTCSGVWARVKFGSLGLIRSTPSVPTASGASRIRFGVPGRNS
jgi:hypothetical protein